MDTSEPAEDDPPACGLGTHFGRRVLLVGRFLKHRTPRHRRVNEGGNEGKKGTDKTRFEALSQKYGNLI